jgi:hypothetical protein
VARSFKRIPLFVGGLWVNNVVCECGVSEGQLHVFGCRWEFCPFCELQMIECDCVYDLIGLRHRANPPETDWLQQEVYSGGLSDEQDQRWLATLEARGRIPFVDTPQLCARCGETWPEAFQVPDVVWEYYAGPAHRKSVLCEQCFGEIRRLVDANRPRPAWLPDELTILEFMQAWRSGDRETLQRIEPQKFKANYRGIRPCRLGDPATG